MRRLLSGIVTIVLAYSLTASAKPPCRRCDPPPLPSGSGDTGTFDPMGKIASTAVKRAQTYELAVERVGTGDVTEFTPVDVRWKLSVSVIGVAGPTPGPEDVYICPVIGPPSTTCAKVTGARAGKTYNGTMSVAAPPAGQQAPLVLVVAKKDVPPGAEDYGQQIVVQEGQTTFDVGATYDAAITAFEVLTTRSAVVDTDWITLKGMVKSVPPDPSEGDEKCGYAGFSWCVINQKYGDAGDGRHELNVRVGPYFLVPERQQDLRFLFYIDNHSDDGLQDIGQAVADGFSKAGMIALSAYGAQSGSSGTSSFAGQLDTAMEAFHSSAFASCDGVVAQDIVVLSNVTIENQPQFTLEAMTRANGSVNTTLPTIYYNKDGNTRCDRRGGNYRVTYTVYRTSWRDWGFQPRY